MNARSAKNLSVAIKEEGRCAWDCQRAAEIAATLEPGALPNGRTGLVQDVVDLR